MTPVEAAALGALSATAAVPSFDRAALKTGIVHIGVGNFHRAHQLVYLDELFGQGQAHEWGVTGLSVRLEDKGLRDDLVSQDCLYTVTEVSEAGADTRVIGALVDFVEPGNRAAMLAALTAPDTRIVSLTITEGGYYVSGDTPDLGHPDLVADAADLADARTVFGLIVSAIAARRAAGAPPLTVLSCDNLPHNGDLTRTLVEGLARAADPDLAAHIAQSVTFPNSMVDRITPATTPQQVEQLKAQKAIADKRPVFCEPFKQWVIEDRFASGRPSLEAVGVTFVEDVTPYELMKLRILNAGHATIAYPAALLGIELVHEAMREPLVARFLASVEKNYLLPASPSIEGVSREDYLATVTHRFGNPEVRDTTRRLCLDGSNRQPKFVLPAARELLAKGQDVSGLALVSALWCRYAYGELEDGTPVEPNDPDWDTIRAAAIEAKQDPSRFLAMRRVFGDLGEDPRYGEAFAGHLRSLWARGVRDTVEDYLRQKPA